MKGNIVFWEINQRALYLAQLFEVLLGPMVELICFAFIHFAQFLEGGAYHLRGPYIRDD